MCAMTSMRASTLAVNRLSLLQEGIEIVTKSCGSGHPELRAD